MIFLKKLLKGKKNHDQSQGTQSSHQVLKVLKSLELLRVLFPTSKGSWIDFEVLKNQQIDEKNNDILFLYALFIEIGPLPFGFDLCVWVRDKIRL